MAYTVKYHGYDVSCETVEDVRALLKEAGTPTMLEPTAHANGAPRGAIAGLLGKLRSDQLQLVRALSDNGTVAREKLMQMVNISDAHQFGGLLIGISKSASGSGIDSPVETTEERLNGNGPRSYHYKIKDGVKAEVKAALSGRLF